VLFEQRLDRILIVVLERLEGDQLRVAALSELRIVVQDVAMPPLIPARSCGPSGRSRRRAAGHVLAPVVAKALRRPPRRRSCARPKRSPAMPRKKARPEVAP